jgi:hypothetical protein
MQQDLFHAPRRQRFFRDLAASVSAFHHVLHGNM